MLLKWDRYSLEEMENDEREEGWGNLGASVVGDGTRPAGTQAPGYGQQRLHTGYDATKLGQNEMISHFKQGPLPPNAENVQEYFASFHTTLVNHYAAFKAQHHT